MYKRMSVQAVALVLVFVFVAAAAIASILYFVRYGFDFSQGPSVSENIGSLTESVFSGEIKGGIQVDQEKTEALQGLNAVSVQTVSEEIRIIPVEGNEVKAHFYGTYKSSDPDFKPQLVVDRTGGSLKIKVEYTKKFAIHYNSNLKLDVSVPAQYAEELETLSTSGEITANGFTLDRFTSKTVSGDVDAKQVNAREAAISTTSGEAGITGAYDSFSFSTVSGDLAASEFTAKESSLKSTSGELRLSGNPGDVTAKTVSGGIELEYAAFANRIDIATTSGEVAVKLPESAGFELDYSSSSGEASCDFPINAEAGGNHDKRLKGTVGNGEGDIKVSTISGDLQINK